MTKYEIAKLFNINIVKVSKSFAEAQRNNPSLATKANSYNKNRKPDFTLEEVIEGMTPWGITPMFIRILKENFISHSSGYDYKSIELEATPSIKTFLFFYENAVDYKCCALCSFLTARAINYAGKKPKPYCNLYQTFFFNRKNKVDIYKDRCSSFIKSEKDPLIYFSTGPVPLSYLKKQNTDMAGIPQDQFISKRARGEPLIVLKDAFSKQ